jgi:acetyl-CoA carboxylase biotin carboxyl carrier protein
MTGIDPLKDLEQLVEDFRTSGLRELHARCGDFEVYLSQDPDAPGLDGPRVSVSGGTARSAAPAVPAQAPAAPASTAPASAAPPAGRQFPEGAQVVRAPYLGTFYRSPKPGSPAYVEVGSRVTAETELCLVEVMKLFTAVRADVSGTIAEVLAQDGDLVEAGQPLFVVAAG